MKSFILLAKEYDDESLLTVEPDIFEAIENHESKMTHDENHFVTGTFTVTVIYEEQE